MLELNEQTCRWPVGDPGSSDFFFCGGKTITGLPYCAYHSRVAYQPAADRRRDARGALVVIPQRVPVRSFPLTDA